MKPLPHSFRGGASITAHKAHRTAASRRAPLPNRLRVPIDSAELCVRVGDRVARGTLLSSGPTPTHAPTSGSIAAVTVDAVLLDVDHAHTAVPPLRALPMSASPESLIERIEACGVTGLGGGGYPTASKLRSALHAGVHTLIVNGVECEPWATADEVLLCERLTEIASGIGVALRACGARRAVLVVDPRNSALAALRGDPFHGFETRTAASRYPAGSERQLIEQCTGAPLAVGARPIAVGILVLNVATVHAIHCAVVDGEPLTERLVAVTGDALDAPGTAWVPIGTPVDQLIAWWQPRATFARRLRGGPLTGIDLEGDAVIDKRTYAISLVRERRAAVACIRCGYCNEACPERLTVDALHFACVAGAEDALARAGIAHCIGCGACEVVCPSHLPLLTEFRAAQAAHIARERAARAAERARSRYARHLERAEAAAAREGSARDRRRAVRRTWLEDE